MYAQGDNVWTLSPFNSSRSNLFLTSTDYTTQLRNLCRDLLYPEKEQVTLSKDRGNSTNHCAAERGNLRELALTCYVLCLSSTAARVGRWTQIPSSWRHSSRMKCTLSTNGIICMWDQCPPLPIYAMLPELAWSCDYNWAGKGSAPRPVFLPKREGIPSPFLCWLIHKGHGIIGRDVRLLQWVPFHMWTRLFCEKVRHMKKYSTSLNISEVQVKNHHAVPLYIP